MLGYQVDSVFPLTSLKSFNTSISILGRDFSNVLSYSCKFVIGKQNFSVPAQFLSSTSLNCEVPAIYQSGSGTMTVHCDSMMYAMHKTSYEFVDVPQFSSVFPRNGYEIGGSFVSIRSKTLNGFWQVACKFGSISTTAVAVYNYNMSEWSIKCQTPASEPGEYPIFVSPNGQDYIYTGLNFTYYPLSVVKSVYPSRIVNTSSFITLFGNNLNISTSVCCKFGFQDTVNGAVLSTNEVRCTLPSLWKQITHGFTASVQISSNCVDFVDTGLLITKLSSPKPIKTSPDSGYFSGGTSVIVFSEGIGKNTPGMVKCAFGGTEVLAYIVDENRTICSSPSAVIPVSFLYALAIIFQNHNLLTHLFFSRLIQHLLS
jgi:hypothetical protein